MEYLRAIYENTISSNDSSFCSNGRYACISRTEFRKRTEHGTPETNMTGGTNMTNSTMIGSSDNMTTTSGSSGSMYNK